MTRAVTVAQVLLLAGWIGAVMFFGAFVAPAAFAVLPTRALAGAVVGRTLQPLFIAGAAAGALVTIAGVVSRKSLGRGVLGGMLVMSCALSHLVVGARISTLRQAIGPSLDALSPDDPRRLMFGRLHALSVAGLGIGVVAAVGALWLILRALARDEQRPEV